jgi:hypothetical protein
MAGDLRWSWEATGVYWQAPWAILEYEFECMLVNARHIKQVTLAIGDRRLVGVGGDDRMQAANASASTPAALTLAKDTPETANRSRTHLLRPGGVGVSGGRSGAAVLARLARASHSPGTETLAQTAEGRPEPPLVLSLSAWDRRCQPILNSCVCGFRRSSFMLWASVLPLSLKTFRPSPMWLS